MLCLIGVTRIEDYAATRIEGQDLAISRGDLTALRFVGLTVRDLVRLASAGRFYLNERENPASGPG